MDISIEAANEYFAAGNHARAAEWAAFDVDDGEEGVESSLKEAAILQAARGLSRVIGNDIEGLDIIEPAFHPDYAVFEQALHLLMVSQSIANGEQTAPKWKHGDMRREGEREGDAPPMIHPEAMAWLTGNVRIEMRRG